MKVLGEMQSVIERCYYSLSIMSNSTTIDNDHINCHEGTDCLVPASEMIMSYRPRPREQIRHQVP